MSTASVIDILEMDEVHDLPGKTACSARLAVSSTNFWYSMRERYMGIHIIAGSFHSTA
jgi:hypothetical protein